MTPSLLLRRPGRRYRSRDQAIEAAGGRWRVMRPFERQELADAVHQNGVRALSVGAKDTAFLADLRHLEFLDIWGTPDTTDFPPMERLRGLSFDSGWVGRFDFSLVPNVEWLFIGGGGGGRNKGLETLFAGHPRVRRMRIAGYPEPDLRALTRLPSLERVEIVAGRKLVSLAGAADMAPSMTELFLALCPKLESIAGIEALAGLKYLHLESCNRLHDITSAARLRLLAYLDAGLPKGIDSLRAFSGHQSIEYLSVSRVLDGDFTPLTTMPRLRLVAIPPQYKVPAGQYRYLHEFDDDDPVKIRGWRLAGG